MTVKMPTPSDDCEWAFQLHFVDSINSLDGQAYLKVGVRLTQYAPRDSDTRSVYPVAWDGLQLETFGYVSWYGDTKGQGQRQMACTAGWQPEFAGPSKLTLSVAEEITKTLRQIARAQERLANQVGDQPQSFGAAVARLMAVLGIRYCLEAKGGYSDRWADGERYRRWSKRDIAYYIDGKIIDWVIAGQAVPA